MIKSAISLYQFNQELALNSLKEMTRNHNPAVRMNTILALSEISSPETVEILLNLIDEPDYPVKKTLLEALLKLRENPSLSEETRQKISSALREEKLKREWIF